MIVGAKYADGSDPASVQLTACSSVVETEDAPKLYIAVFNPRYMKPEASIFPECKIEL